jgi:hypothetical protein
LRRDRCRADQLQNPVLQRLQAFWLRSQTGLCRGPEAGQKAKTPKTGKADCVLGQRGHATSKGRTVIILARSSTTLFSCQLRWNNVGRVRPQVRI